MLVQQSEASFGSTEYLTKAYCRVVCFAVDSHVLKLSKCMKHKLKMNTGCPLFMPEMCYWNHQHKLNGSKFRFSFFSKFLRLHFFQVQPTQFTVHKFIFLYTFWKALSTNFKRHDKEEIFLTKEFYLYYYIILL